MKAVRNPCILVVAVLALLLIAGISGGQSLARSRPVTRLMAGMPAPAATAARNTIEDVFTRPNQTGWGTTTNPDGVANVAWDLDGNGTRSYVTISTNTGVYGYQGATNVVGIASAGTATHNGGDSLVKFAVSAVGHVTPYTVQNACSDKSCYYGARLHTSQNKLELAKRSGGSTAILASVPFTASANTFYWMRLDVRVLAGSDTLHAKIWAAGTPEPAPWTVTATDNGPLAANRVGTGGSWDQTGGGESINYVCYAFALHGLARPCAGGPGPTVTPTPPASGIQHYLYVLPEGGTMYVYDMDHGHSLVQTITLPPSVSYVRGLAADPPRHMLYIAYGGVSTGGMLLKMDLLNHQVLYTASMPLGVDSFGLAPDGKTIYMPDGDGQSDGIWRVVNTATGKVIGVLATGGHNPHNTIVTRSGKYVLMGPRLSNYLVLGDTATKQVIRQIGPVQNGVRPFTVNGQGTLAFIETSGFIGFDVAAIATGKILWKVPVPGYSYDPTSLNAPSHGISLSPDEKELYISDWPHSMVHVFAVSGLPTRRPRWLANIPVHNMVGSESPCVGSNCQKEGWVLHSRDGRFVYVGDAGDVIDTTARRRVGYLPSLANTRKYIEIDWENGPPIATTTRYGLGYVTN